MSKPYAYYNEWDKNAAAWIRQLIKMKLITDGEVDERSITEVQASDIRGFNRVHFFAGIAGWDYALQLARWPEDEPVCTASLPCQPFSTAGRQLGKADERHLLPHFIELVRQCKFPTIFGEQVPGAIKHGWLDDLCDEMGREGYTVRADVRTAAGAGAPHIRQRLFWMVRHNGNGSQQGRQTAATAGHGNTVEPASRIGRVGNAESAGYKASPPECRQQHGEWQADAPTSPCWIGSEWIYCRDNKYRPIKPGIKPLVNGISKGMVRGGDISAPINADETQEARVMRLKGYGNSICPQTAAMFIQEIKQ